MFLPLSCFYVALFFRLSMQLSFSTPKSQNNIFVKKWLSAIYEMTARPGMLARYLSVSSARFLFVSQITLAKQHELNAIPHTNILNISIKLIC